MAKQIIILGSNINAAPGLMSVNYLLWLTPAKAAPLPSALSAYSGASQVETQAIQSGTVVEEQHTNLVPLTFSDGQIEDFTSAHWAARQTYFNSYKGPGDLRNVYIDPAANNGQWAQG